MGIRKGCGEHQLGPEKAPQKAEEWEGSRGGCVERKERTRCVDQSVGSAVWLEHGLVEEVW